MIPQERVMQKFPKASEMYLTWIIERVDWKTRRARENEQK